MNQKITPVVLGTGETAVTLGGASALPFYDFDIPAENPPAIGIEIPDRFDAPQQGLRAFFDGCTTPAQMAKRAETLPEVSFVCLHLKRADPNGENISVEDCIALVRSVCEATRLPVVVMGCRHLKKDAALFAGLAELKKNILFLSAREENYGDFCRSDCLVGAESSVDINLAKQLNVMLLQGGVKAEHIVMNAGSAAVGYGFEYLSSTLERIRLAALQQGDEQLQMPIITPVFADVWEVKESTAEDMPEWGDSEERGIHMEIATAAACLASGSDAVILRHPKAIEAVGSMIWALRQEG